MSKCSDTNVVFQTAIFLILFVRNNKRSSGIDGKPATAFPEFVYIAVILSYISASNCSLNRLNLWLLFFRWFPHGKSAACKYIPDKITLKSWAFLLVLYSLLHTSIFHFLFNLRHTKPIENLNVWKRTEVEAGAVIKESSGAGATVIKTMSSGAGATFVNSSGALVVTPVSVMAVEASGYDCCMGVLKEWRDWPLVFCGFVDIDNSEVHWQ